MTEQDVGPDGGSDNASPQVPTGSIGQASVDRDLKPDMGQRISEGVQSVKEAVGEDVAAATDAAKQVASRQKNIIADKLGGIAVAMDKVADELGQGEQRDIGRLMRTLGASMRGLSEQINDQDIGQVAKTAENYGRQQPVAFLGMAALAGFAASRFLMASAQGHGEAASKPHADGASMEGRTNG
ncbi:MULTISPECIES: nutrient deprivation-induced protein [unclassified Rhizobium]|uniref:nutrient deprivation-induced protein n=1 Tax=unclassified Rhizobium TaxID=2613769 RepID=UPI0011303072|nr:MULTISPECIES: nutrient deprivation-induced protein [unclassified Rhizobium]